MPKEIQFIGEGWFLRYNHKGNVYSCFHSNILSLNGTFQ